MISNALISMIKLILGIYLASGWFITNAVYYIILSIARGHALSKYTAAKQIDNPQQRFNMEFAVYKRSGIFLCLIGISYLLVCLRMYLRGDATIYKGYAVFLVAAVAFTKLSFAVHGIIIARHIKDPVIAALKAISFVDAMVSIVVTQCTLLTMTASVNAVVSSAILGMGFSILFIIIGLCMLVKKKKQ